jgi:hypothetical protein
MSKNAELHFTFLTSNIAKKLNVKGFLRRQHKTVILKLYLRNLLGKCHVVNKFAKLVLT